MDIDKCQKSSFIALQFLENGHPNRKSMAKYFRLWKQIHQSYQMMVNPKWFDLV